MTVRSEEKVREEQRAEQEVVTFEDVTFEDRLESGAGAIVAVPLRNAEVELAEATGATLAEELAIP